MITKENLKSLLDFRKKLLESSEANSKSVATLQRDNKALDKNIKQEISELTQYLHPSALLSSTSLHHSFTEQLNETKAIVLWLQSYYDTFTYDDKREMVMHIENAFLKLREDNPYFEKIKNETIKIIERKNSANLKAKEVIQANLNKCRFLMSNIEKIDKVLADPNGNLPDLIQELTFNKKLFPYVVKQSLFTETITPAEYKDILLEIRGNLSVDLDLLYNTKIKNEKDPLGMKEQIEKFQGYVSGKDFSTICDNVEKIVEKSTKLENYDIAKKQKQKQIQDLGEKASLYKALIPKIDKLQKVDPLNLPEKDIQLIRQLGDTLSSKALKDSYFAFVNNISPSEPLVKNIDSMYQLVNKYKNDVKYSKITKLKKGFGIYKDIALFNRAQEAEIKKINKLENELRKSWALGFKKKSSDGEVYTFNKEYSERFNNLQQAKATFSELKNKQLLQVETYISEALKQEQEIVQPEVKPVEIKVEVKVEVEDGVNVDAGAKGNVDAGAKGNVDASAKGNVDASAYGSDESDYDGDGASFDDEFTPNENNPELQYNIQAHVSEILKAARVQYKHREASILNIQALFQPSSQQPSVEAIINKQNEINDKFLESVFNRVLRASICSKFNNESAILDKNAIRDAKHPMSQALLTLINQVEALREQTLKEYKPKDENYFRAERLFSDVNSLMGNFWSSSKDANAVAQFKSDFTIFINSENDTLGKSRGWKRVVADILLFICSFGNKNKQDELCKNSKFIGFFDRNQRYADKLGEINEAAALPAAQAPELVVENITRIGR